jgi:phosphohistidine phosphatase
MKLWIMRHGEANPMIDSDANRTLTSWGHAESRSSAEEVLRKGERPDILLVSPYRRAQQTAVEVHSLMPEARLETVECLTPESSQDEIISYLAGIPETRIMLVSHQPLVSLLVDFLSGQQISMRTACVALIESEYWSRKQGELKWVI